MTMELATALARLTTGYYNAQSKTDANPGGFGANGHVDNLPEIAEALGVVGQHAADVAGEVILNGVGVRLRYTFDATTADADPGAEGLRANNATPAAVTEFYLSTTSGGADVTAALALFATSTSTIKGQLLIGRRDDAAAWALYNVTGKTDAAGYRKIAVAYLAGTATSPLATDGASLVAGFAMTGNQGDAGNDGNDGNDGGGLASVADDPSPQLGADLDVNSYGLVSTEDGDIPIQPDGTGRTSIKNPTITGSAEGGYDNVGDVTGAASVTGAPYSRIRLTGDTTVTLADPFGTAIMGCWTEVAQGTSGGWIPTFTGYSWRGSVPAWSEQAEAHVTLLGRAVTPTGIKLIWAITEVAP